MYTYHFPPLRAPSRYLAALPLAYAGMALEHVCMHNPIYV